MPQPTQVDRIDTWTENTTFYKVDLFNEKVNKKIIGGFENFVVICQSSFDGDKIFWLMKSPNDWATNNLSKYTFVMKLSFDVYDNFHYVAYSYLSKKYRKKGIAARFYQYLIVHHGINIVSGSEQSKGGRSIWLKLGQMDNLTIKLSKNNSYKSYKNKFRILKQIKLKKNSKAWDYDDKDTLNSSDYVFVASKKKKRGRPPKQLAA